MKRVMKKYKSPVNPWDKERIEKEKQIIKNFGLKKKREIWRAETVLRKFRRMTRELEARKDEKKERMLIEKLVKLGLLTENASLDDVLGLTLDKLFERRLQTIVYKKGMANTPKQARQLIVHGKVVVGGRRVVFPSYLVSKDEENLIRVMSTKVKMVGAETTS